MADSPNDKPLRVNLREARASVQAKRTLKGNSIYSRWVYGFDPSLPVGSHAARPVRYVVYSYGNHFPMYCWDTHTQRWYGNSDKYSRTTSRHQSACCPYGVDIVYVNTDTLKHIVNFGVFEAVAELASRGCSAAFA